MTAPDNTNFNPPHMPASGALPLNLCFNLLPIRYSRNEAEMCFTLVSLEGLYPFKPAEVPKELTRMTPKDRMPEYFYTSTLEEGPGVSLRVKFSEYPSLARLWCMQRIRRLLEPQFDYCQYHDPYTTEFWYSAERMPAHAPEIGICGKLPYDQQAFHRFILEVIHRKRQATPELLIGCNGTGFILNANIEELAARHPDVRNIERMAFRGKICCWDELPEMAWYHSNEILPLLSKEMARKLELKPVSCCGGKSASNEFSRISTFLKTYLLNGAFLSVATHNGRLRKVGPAEYGRAASAGSRLLFGEGGLSDNPSEGMTAYGPLQLPPGRHFNCFIVCFGEDKQRAARVFECIVTTDASRRLGSYMRVPLRFSNDHSIFLSSKANAEQQLVHRLTEMVFDPATVWCAFFVCPAKGQMPGSVSRQLHARITELLLHRGVVVQKVPGNVSEGEFSTALQRMGTDVTARLGGTPWRPSGNALPDPVVGFAVNPGDHPSGPEVGAAVFFAPGGRFAGANSFTPANEREWGGLSVEFFKKWEMNGGKAHRLVLHLSRPLKPHEQTSLQAMVNDGRPGLQVVVMVVRRSRSRDIRAFNSNDPEAGIPDGTWVCCSRSRYLLYTRSSSGGKSNDAGLSIPLTVSFHILNAGNDTIGQLAPGLLDQLHCLIRMHQPSSASSHLPVTLTYPALLARIIPRLRNKALPEYGRAVPWFI